MKCTDQLPLKHKILSMMLLALCLTLHKLAIRSALAASGEQMTIDDIVNSINGLEKINDGQDRSAAINRLKTLLKTQLEEGEIRKRVTEIEKLKEQLKLLDDPGKGYLGDREKAIADAKIEIKNKQSQLNSLVQIAIDPTVPKPPATAQHAIDTAKENLDRSKAKVVPAAGLADDASSVLKKVSKIPIAGILAGGSILGINIAKVMADTTLTPEQKAALISKMTAQTAAEELTIYGVLKDTYDSSMSAASTATIMGCDLSGGKLTEAIMPWIMSIDGDLLSVKECSADSEVGKAANIQGRLNEIEKYLSCLHSESFTAVTMDLKNPKDICTLTMEHYEPAGLSTRSIELCAAYRDLKKSLSRSKDDDGTKCSWSNCKGWSYEDRAAQVKNALKVRDSFVIYYGGATQTEDRMRVYAPAAYGILKECNFACAPEDATIRKLNGKDAYGPSYEKDICNWKLPEQPNTQSFGEGML